MRVKSAINAPQDFKTSATAVNCAHTAMMTFKDRTHIISAHAVTCAENQRQKHYTNLKHLLQQSIAHKVSVEILKEKTLKIAMLFHQLTYGINDKIYTSYKKLRNLLRQLLSCKISHEIQLKNLKYLPPQSLACEVYRKQENEVKDLLAQSFHIRNL